jgi:vacuolar-type H+-ATPase subunit I/STV1
MKKNIKIRLYDLYVLKPLWVLCIASLIVFLINREWLISGALVFMLFLLGIIGQGLYPQSTFNDLSKGTTPSQEEIENDNSSPELSHQESLIVARATFKVAGLIGLMVFFMSLHNNVKWYYSLLIAGSTGYLAMVIIGIYYALMIRRKLKNKIK